MSELDPRSIPASANVGTTITSQELSKARLDALVASGKTLTQNLSGYLGTTAYGSTVRGEARPDSDIDACVFVEASDTTGFEARRNDGRGGKPYDYMFEGNYDLWSLDNAQAERVIKAAFAKHDLSTEGNDIDIQPINPEIVSDTVETLMSEATRFMQGETKTPRISRNIRQMFYAPVHENGLHAYQEQALQALSTDFRGESAWLLIRSSIAHFEGGRNNTDLVMQHRYVPLNLEEARAYYLHQK